MLEKSIKIIDNVLDTQHLARWYQYYKSTSFRRSASESTKKENIYFCRDVFYKELIEIFDYENKIYPHAKELDNLVTEKVHRSYINIFDEGDKFIGHKDMEEIPEDKYAVSCVLFLNPEWEDTGGGLAFEKDDERIVVQNKFNRLIVFNGDIWHCVQAFKGNKARVTLYIQFNNATRDLPKLAAQNEW